MSMGGMGALSCYFKNPGKYKSVSAFCPISNPTQSFWGKNAFEKYLGSVEAGKAYDPTHLVGEYNGPKTPILIDQGSHDKFLRTELLVDNFLDAAYKAGHEVQFRMREGYTHDYFFVGTFIEDHIEFHARYLKH